MRDEALCVVPPKMPIMTLLVADIKPFIKSSKSFAAEWESRLPYTKARDRKDININFLNSISFSKHLGLLGLLPCHGTGMGKHVMLKWKIFHLHMYTCVVYRFLGQDLDKCPETA